jgi:hypothetical protein
MFCLLPRDKQEIKDWMELQDPQDWLENRVTMDSMALKERRYNLVTYLEPFIFIHFFHFLSCESINTFYPLLPLI